MLLGLIMAHLGAGSNADRRRVCGSGVPNQGRLALYHQSDSNLQVIDGAEEEGHGLRWDGSRSCFECWSFKKRPRVVSDGTMWALHQSLVKLETPKTKV